MNLCILGREKRTFFLQHSKGHIFLKKGHIFEKWAIRSFWWGGAANRFTEKSELPSFNPSVHFILHSVGERRNRANRILQLPSIQ